MFLRSCRREKEFVVENRKFVGRSCQCSAASTDPLTQAHLQESVWKLEVTHSFHIRPQAELGISTRVYGTSSTQVRSIGSNQIAMCLFATSICART